MRIVDIITPYHHHQSFSCRHHLPSTHHPTSLVSSTFNNSSMSLQPSTFSTFYPSILHRPSILSFFIDLLSFHPSSTFNLLHPSSTFNLLIPSTSILHRPSTSSFIDLQPPSFIDLQLHPSSTFDLLQPSSTLTFNLLRLLAHTYNLGYAGWMSHGSER